MAASTGDRNAITDTGTHPPKILRSRYQAFGPKDVRDLRLAWRGGGHGGRHACRNSHYNGMREKGCIRARTLKEALMHGPEKLRDAARLYLLECRSASNHKDRCYFAECAFEFAQMAEALERSISNQKESGAA